MGQKKQKPAKSKIEIQTRKPEKRGIFANLGSDRPKNDHPLREILNFPIEPESQNSDERISKTSSSGYPNSKHQDSHIERSGLPNNTFPDIQNSTAGYPILNSQDIQPKPIDYPNTENKDIQVKSSRYPTTTSTDSQTTDPGYQTDNSPDIQSETVGHPKHTDLDILISKESKGISKSQTQLDSKISSAQNLDIQNKEKRQSWKKYDKTRKSKGVFLRTNEEITKKFKQFCIANDWDFSQGTELAWNRLMNDLDSQTPASLDSLIALDDRRLKMLFKTKGLIINLYLRYNAIFNELSAAGGKKWNARWSPRDDEAAHRFNDLPTAIIELGILQTQIQKGFHTSRIQTFKYYTDEIEKVLASGVSDEMLETILSYHRQIWRNQTGREIDLSFLENQKN